MSTQVVAGPVETKTEQPVEQPKKAKRAASVGFRGPDGTSLRLSWKVRKDGSVQTWATHKPKKDGKSVRGATEQHATLDVAEKAMAKLIEKALKLGWVRRERKVFASKPDAFTALPAPAKGKK